MSTMQNPYIIEKLVRFENAPGVGSNQSLVIAEEQFIPDEFLSDLRREREDSISTPAGEFHRVCSVPTGIADKWKREGFDIYREPAEEILKRLRKEQLDGFITSNKVH
jgi:hypothetical protein